MGRVRFTAGVIISVLIICGCGGGRGKVQTWKKGPMPETGAFDGCYQSDFGRLELTMQYDGSVTGLYEDELHSGRIQGKADGNLLEFKWTQWNYEMRGKERKTTGSGVFQYIVEKIEGANKTREYSRLDGWWGYDDGKPKNRWNAQKLSTNTEKKLTPYKPGKLSVKQESDYNETVGFAEEEQRKASGVSSKQAADSEPKPAESVPSGGTKETDEKKPKQEEDGLLDIF
jgi:hypothetical protein